MDLRTLWPNPEELAAAVRAALSSIAEQLDACRTAGASDYQLLRALMTGLMPGGDYCDVLNAHEPREHVLLRALALIGVRVPILHAAELARLEFAAEAAKRLRVLRELWDDSRY